MTDESLQKILETIGTHMKTLRRFSQVEIHDDRIVSIYSVPKNPSFKADFAKLLRIVSVLSEGMEKFGYSMTTTLAYRNSSSFLCTIKVSK